MLQDSSIPWIFLLILLLFRLVFVEGGGRLLAPQGRGSVWEQEAGGLPDFENESNCGGVLRQWGSWGGMCGVCGDEWGIPSPRPRELGGRWGSGGVVETYLTGQSIDVEIEITQSLGGSFQLQLCPDPENESEECFSKHPLSLATTSNTTYTPLVGDSLVKLAYQLPLNMTCSHCVLRWRYTTNHTVTLDQHDNLYQEEFRVCADIAIQGGKSEEQTVEVNTMQAAAGSEVSMFEVKEAVTQETAVTGVDVFKELVSKTFSEFRTLITPVTRRTDVTTIATSDDVIENSTESVETPLTTTIDNNIEIDLDEDNVKLIDHEETIDRNIIKDEHVVEKADNAEEITVKPGVMEIKIISGESSKEEASVYTVSPQQIPVEYSLITIRNNALSDETNREDEKPDYEITRNKLTAKSDSQISSSPANVTSAIPLPASIPALQTTDGISEAATVTPTGVSVAASTTTQTTTTTTVSTTETIIKSSAVILPLFISSETHQETTTVQCLSTQSSSTTTNQNPTTVTTLSTTTTVPTSLKSTTTQTTTTTTQTLPMVTLMITNPVTKSTMNTTPTTTTHPPTKTAHITTTPTVLPKNVPKQAKDSKIVSNSPNSISVEKLKKVPTVPSQEPTSGVQTNHTVIYQVFSSGTSLGYGLFLSVPAAIIFFVGIFLIYVKKSSEIQSPKKAQSYNQSGSTMYHIVPKDDKEVEEGDITQLTNMTSSTTLITNKYIPMCPEYATIPDVVPSSVRNNQRHRLDDSVDAHCCPGNSMPNLPQVTSTPPQAAYHKAENTAVQYSSLNEFNSSDNSPKPGGKEISTKRWQSDDLDAEKKAQDAPVDGWTPHQRWKSEDWEKDQSFIALLARRLEHVDSRAEVTEL